MFLRMECLLPFIFTNCLNSLPIPDNYKVPSNNVGNNQLMFNVEDYTLLASLPESKIYLYAMDWKEEDKKQSGVYRDILLDLNGKQRYFPWRVDTNPTFKPQLILSDINADGIKELIVIITTDTGTGILIQEVHVFDVDTYNDIRVMDPIEAVYQNVKTKMTNKNGLISIIINIKGKTFTTTAKESSAESWLNDVSFGSHIEYEVVDNKLIARVGAQVSFSLTVGELVMEYAFKNKRMEVTDINYKEFKDSNIFCIKKELSP